jgi:hypothetical protein
MSQEIVEEVAKRLDAKILSRFEDSNGYQGVIYYVLNKSNTYSIVSVHYGTCAICDFQLGLIESYREMWPDVNNEIPLSAFEPMIQYLFKDNEELGFHSVENLITKFDMIFGVGYSEELVREEVLKYLLRNCL